MITLPTPDNLLAVVYTGIGLAFGRGFGKQLDQDIQNSEWYKKQNPITCNIVKRLLDTLHHWWIGGLLMIYYPDTALYWFGYGLFLDDLPDVPPRIISFIEDWKQYVSNRD